MRALIPALLLLLLPPTLSAQSKPINSPSALPSVFLEALTWEEVRHAIDQGATRILIPTGGTEQNGLHGTLGKHNCVVRYTAERIASTLGNTLIAPILSYVPEEPHMQYAGTISLSEDTFYDLLEDTAESLKRHGFRQIYFLGDSYGNQPPQEELVDDIADDFADDGVLLANLHDYYAKNGQVDWLIDKKGYTPEEIGGHAGIRDTSEMLAACPDWVRTNKIRDNRIGDPGGANGRATQASVEIGKKMLQLKIDSAVDEIRRFEATSP